jgi:hypothetical protein
MRRRFAKWLAVGLTCLAAVPSQSVSARPPASWDRIPVEEVWSGYTHAVSDGQRAWFLHGRDVEVLDQKNQWTRWPGVMPSAVDALSAVCLDRQGRIVVVPGRGQVGFVLDPKTRQVTRLPALALTTGRGAQVAVDSSGCVHVALGGRGRVWGRVVEDRWQPLPALETVTQLGTYSSGLFTVGDSLLAFGDHHVSEYHTKTATWGSEPSKLFTVLGMRPALDRGGMACLDSQLGLIFMTLGKSSKTLGMVVTRNQGVLAGRRFYFLRPRLPIFLDDLDRTLYCTGQGADTWLNLLSRRQGAIYRIRTADLHPLGVWDDKQSDSQSQWETCNSGRIGSVGDLCRERDSACNDLAIPPYFYNQRKNILQRVHRDTLGYSHPSLGPKMGPLHATIGSALCYDGVDRLYLCNGYMKAFWSLRIRAQVPAGQGAGDLLAIPAVQATRLPDLPMDGYSGSRFLNNDNGGGNAALVVHDGAVYGIFDPITRILWRYDPGAVRWSKVDVLPSSLVYNARDGIDLFSYQGRLWVLTRSGLSSYAKDGGWAAVMPMDLPYSSDGGMAALDPITGMAYVVRGEGTADFATVHLPTGVIKILPDYLPDVVSVYGRRIQVTSWGGDRYVCILRGHDTAERWRLQLPADGRL